MSAHVLLNLLNELGERDKVRGLLSILSLFCNELNKFNNTRTQILDSYLSYDIKILLKSYFYRKNVIMSLCMQRHNLSQKSVKQFYCMALFHP